MFRAQKGFLPSVTYILGTVFTGYAFVAYVYNVYYLLRLAGENSSLFASVVQSIVKPLPILILMWAGLFFAGFFPAIRVREDGLRYRYLFVKGLVRWNEMEELVALKKPKGCLALSIQRKGCILLNGLWANGVYGIGVRHENPVLLLSAGLEQRDKIIQEIFEHSRIEAIAH